MRIVAWALAEPWYGDAVTQPSDVYIWTEDDARFGGMSALIVMQDGRNIIAGSDRGTIFSGRLMRNEIGAITSVEGLSATAIRLPSGGPVDRFKGDLESMTLFENGKLALGFEGYSRIVKLGAPAEKTEPVHRWDRFQSYFGNNAFEALATLPDGSLLAITERRGRYGMTKAYVGQGRDWSGPHNVPVSPHYRVTGADVGPDGCLYTLERNFNLFGIKYNVVRHWQAGGLWDPEAPWFTEVLYRSARGRDGNGEAISTWSDGSDMVRITVLTDNGFLPLPRTRLTELSVAPATCR